MGLLVRERTRLEEWGQRNPGEELSGVSGHRMWNCFWPERKLCKGHALQRRFSIIRGPRCSLLCRSVIPSPVTPVLAQGGSVHHHRGSGNVAHPGDVVTVAGVLSLLVVDTKVSSSHGPFPRGSARYLVQADYVRLLSSQRGQQSVPNEQIHIQVMDLFLFSQSFSWHLFGWKEILSVITVLIQHWPWPELHLKTKMWPTGLTLSYVVYHPEQIAWKNGRSSTESWGAVWSTCLDPGTTPLWCLPYSQKPGLKEPKGRYRNGLSHYSLELTFKIFSISVTLDSGFWRPRYLRKKCFSRSHSQAVLLNWKWRPPCSGPFLAPVFF